MQLTYKLRERPSLKKYEASTSTVKLFSGTIRFTSKCLLLTRGVFLLEVKNVAFVCKESCLQCTYGGYLSIEVQLLHFSMP